MVEPAVTADEYLQERLREINLVQALEKPGFLELDQPP